jgi:hypothetical protein
MSIVLNNASSTINLRFIICHMVTMRSENNTNLLRLHTDLNSLQEGIDIAFKQYLSIDESLGELSWDLYYLFNSLHTVRANLKSLSETL